MTYGVKEPIATMVPSFEYVLTQAVQMRNEQNQYLPKWREFSRYYAPYSLRPFEEFATRARNTGLRNRDIRNTIGQQAKDIFAAGYMSLASNPAEKWFAMHPAIGSNTEQKLPGEESDVDEGLIYSGKARDAILKILAATNAYRVLRPCYEDLFWSGQMAMLQEEDSALVTRFRHLPVGSYLVALDFNGFPQTMLISHPMTAAQIVREYGQVGNDGMLNLEHLPTVTTELAKYQADTRFHIWQYIHKNPEYEQGEDGLKGKRYIQVHYFRGGGGIGSNDGPLLHRKAVDAISPGGRGLKYGEELRSHGTDFNPMKYCAWKSLADDVYGHECPGELALGWLKQLQHGELRIGQAIDHMVAPHLYGNSGLGIDVRSVFDLEAGGVTLVNDMKALEHGLQPTHTLQLRLDHTMNNQERMENKVRDLSFTNLILKISELSKSNVTATEVNALRNEQRVILVPTYVDMKDFVFGPMIEDTAILADKQDKLPEMPKTLVAAAEKMGEDAVNMAIEYTSTLEQAQKLTKLTSLERTVGLVGEWSVGFPNLNRKFKTEKIAGHLVDSIGAPTDILVSNDDYFEALERDAQQASEEESLDNEKIAAETAKIQSETAPPAEEAATGVDTAALLGEL